MTKTAVNYETLANDVPSFECVFLQLYPISSRGHGGHARIVVGFTATFAISGDHN